MSLRSGKTYKPQTRMREEGQSSTPVKSMSVTDLLELLMEESQLRVEVKRRRAEKEQEVREEKL